MKITSKLKLAISKRELVWLLALALAALKGCS